MALLIQSSDVYTETTLNLNADGKYQCLPTNGNIGTLPTIFDQNGEFLNEPNSYFFYLKATKGAKDLILVVKPY